MIDLRSPTIVPLRELPDLLPRRRGRKIHISTIYRWAERGVSGVRLETARVGGLLYTSEEALQQFSSRLSRGGPMPTGSLDHTKRIEEARRLLDQHGVR